MNVASKPVIRPYDIGANGVIHYPRPRSESVELGAGNPAECAGILVRFAVLNGYTALGKPVTEAVEKVRPWKGKTPPAFDLRNRGACYRLVVIG